MREILFRGKHIKTGEWVYGYPFIHHDGKAEICTQEENTQNAVWNMVDPLSIGEYTGLLDSNGKQVFDGDIIEFYDSRYDICWTGAVIFGRSKRSYSLGYNIVKISGDVNSREILLWFSLQGVSIRASIIGNIYDMPDAGIIAMSDTETI